MNSNYEKHAKRLFVIAFFLCLSLFALAQVDRAIFISWSLFKPETTKRINQFLPLALQIRPSLSHSGQVQEFSKIGEVLESRAKEGIPALDQFVKLSYTLNRSFLTINAQFQRLLGKETIRQKRLTTLFSFKNYTDNANNSKLCYKTANTAANPTAHIDYLKYFAQVMRKNSIDFLYLKRPIKRNSLDFSPLIREIISKPKLDDLVYEGIKGHMDHLDLMDLWDAQWGEPHEIFFKTDHHWHQESAFRFFQQLSKILEKNYNIEVDEKYLNMGNYEQIVIPKVFLGSTGRFVGYAGGELDDLLVLSPLFPTDFDIKRSTPATSGSGTFDRVFYDTTYLPPGHCYFGGNVGGIYNYREHALIIIKNKMMRNGKKLVTINDSFSSTFVPFLSLFFEEVHMIDTRKFNENIVDYTVEIEADLVLIMNMPSMLGRQLRFPRVN